MIKGMASDADLQFFGVGPIQLHDLPGTMRLWKDNFRGRPMFQPPLSHPPLKGSQLRLPHLLGTDHQQMLKQRLGFEFWGRPQTRFRLRPNLGQRIHSRAPCPRQPWFAHAFRVS